MAAEPRYRVEVWATKCLVVDYSRPLNAYRSVLAACWTDGVANMIAAALNAAEDAGRWKAALEEIAAVRCLMEKHDIEDDEFVDGECVTCAARIVLKAPEPKEALT